MIQHTMNDGFQLMLNRRPSANQKSSTKTTSNASNVPASFRPKKAGTIVVSPNAAAKVASAGVAVANTSSTIAGANYNASPSSNFENSTDLSASIVKGYSSTGTGNAMFAKKSDDVPLTKRAIPIDDSQLVMSDILNISQGAAFSNRKKAIVPDIKVDSKVDEYDIDQELTALLRWKQQYLEKGEQIVTQQTDYENSLMLQEQIMPYTPIPSSKKFLEQQQHQHQQIGVSSQLQQQHSAQFRITKSRGGFATVKRSKNVAAERLQMHQEIQQELSGNYFKAKASNQQINPVKPFQQSSYLQSQQQQQQPLQFQTQSLQSDWNYCTAPSKNNAIIMGSTFMKRSINSGGNNNNNKSKKFESNANSVQTTTTTKRLVAKQQRLPNLMESEGIMHYGVNGVTPSILQPSHSQKVISSLGNNNINNTINQSMESNAIAPGAATKMMQSVGGNARASVLLAEKVNNNMSIQQGGGAGLQERSSGVAPPRQGTTVDKQKRSKAISTRRMPTADPGNRKVSAGINFAEKQAKVAVYTGGAQYCVSGADPKKHAGNSQNNNNNNNPIIDFAEQPFRQKERQAVVLTDEEKKLYGDRFIEGYSKIKLLGKGGFAAVWLAREISTGREVAVKQICRVNGSDSFAREARVNSTFYESSGSVRQHYENHAGINSILRCFGSRNSTKDVFFVYELGGTSLSSLLSEMKGEFYKGERVYRIDLSVVHAWMFQVTRNSLLKQLCRSVLETLSLLADSRVIHGDLKPENILVVMKEKHVFEKVSVIDFGSSFGYNDSGVVGMATPEYMPPEVVGMFAMRAIPANAEGSQMEQLARMTKPWSIDMWSFGAVLIEMLTGVPHWLSYKCRVVHVNGASVLRHGLFSTKGQDFEKIYAKQVGFCADFQGFAKSIVKNFDCLETARLFFDLLERMMKLNPIERISPDDALKHPFFYGYDDDDKQNKRSVRGVTSNSRGVALETNGAVNVTKVEEMNKVENDAREEKQDNAEGEVEEQEEIYSDNYDSIQADKE